MKRIALIARREYLAYARTIGFWLSLISLPLFGLLGFGMSSFMDNQGTGRQIAIVDLVEATPGQMAAGEALVLAMAGDAASDDAPGVVVRETPPELSQAGSPEAADTVARRLVGEDAALDGVVILTPTGQGATGGVGARIWASRAGDDRMEGEVRQALTQVNRNRDLIALGVDPAAVDRIDAARPEVVVLSPQSVSGGEVSLQDRLPGLIGFILGMTLWSLIITGASILLNSVMEEKANRVLEVLLASASATEVLAGKVAGVAMVTLTVLAAWGVFAGIGLTFLGQSNPEIVQAIQAALGGILRDGLWLWLMAYFLGGYLMYAVIFAAIGAFCETPRDAQTLIGPIMMALIVPIFVMQMAIRDPDLALAKTLSWAPPFTPFLMSARAPSGPPLLELAGTLLVMLAFTALVVWVSSRAFRAGALTSGKFDWKSLIGLVRGGGA